MSTRPASTDADHVIPSCYCLQQFGAGELKQLNKSAPFSWVVVSAWVSAHSWPTLQRKNVFLLLNLSRPLAFQDRIFIFKTIAYNLEHPKEMKLCISMSHTFVGKAFAMQIVNTWWGRLAGANRKVLVCKIHRNGQKCQSTVPCQSGPFARVCQ